MSIPVTKFSLLCGIGGFAEALENSSTVATDEETTDAYRFELPPELIAQSHAHPRDASRLLVMRGGTVEHAQFRDLATFLRAGDLLVLNETKVIAARVLGRRPTGAQIEVLLLRPAAGPRYDADALHWLALVKPGKKMPVGATVEFAKLGRATVRAVHDDGVRELEFALDVPFERFLEAAGRLPLPPYISNETQEAQQDYQTIFARTPGSVAAPTASLHFSEDVLRDVQAAGVELAHLTLNVGLGTFRPVKARRLSEHHMHEELFDIPAATAAAIAAAKAQGRRVVAAGTTVVRALEGSAQNHGSVRAGEDTTALFIQPGFPFRVVDALITNFHLPESTLLVLVSAFSGRERVLAAYAEAVQKRYRFFSFGDAMYIER